MYITLTLTTMLAPLTALSIPQPRGAGSGAGALIAIGALGGGRGGGGKGGGHGGGKSGGSYKGHSWSGSSFTQGGFTGYLGGVYVGHGPFHGGADDRHHDREPPADCVVAQTVKKELAPTVACQYTWEHWHGDNFLYYAIRISPTGQDGTGWADGIIDNIRGEVRSSLPVHLMLSPVSDPGNVEETPAG